MDTIAPKTPATLPFAAWQTLSSADAARRVQARIDSLPAAFRRAALAWMRPETELAAALAAGAGEAPLRGLPYLLKDLFDLRGLPTQAGSTFLATARGLPGKDSTIVHRLNTLGAACAGKTHLVEFAAGLFGDNSHYGDCPHPSFPERLSGGSSSGSASLVAAGVAPLAIGTDTGGSVRVPAAFCGLHGFRLSPRDELIRDAMALSPSLDTTGWFTAHASDMLTAITALVGAPAEAGRLRGCHLPATAFAVAFDPDTAAAYARAAGTFAEPADAETTAALLASWRGAIEAYTVTALHEANAVHRDWLEPYRSQYEPSIWQRFTDGGKYSPAQLTAAAATFAEVRTTFRRFFADYDFLILPATPFPALRKAECTPEARKALLTLTTPASLAGLPVLTIPFTLTSGLTSGLQVVLPDARSGAIRSLLKAK